MDAVHGNSQPTETSNDAEGTMLHGTAHKIEHNNGYGAVDEPQQDSLFRISGPYVTGHGVTSIPSPSITTTGSR